MSGDSRNPNGDHHKKALVVINPVAGVSDMQAIRQAVIDFFETNGWQYDIYETQPDEDLREVVRKAIRQGAQVVIAAGGDGTVGGVVNGLVNSGVPLGILPLGTGNILARDLNIPLDVTNALQLIASEEPNIASLDVIQIGERYYVLNVSIGVTAKTMQETPREEKRRFGMLAYLWRALGTLNRPPLHRFIAEVDGRKLRFDASEVMITNDKFMGLQPRLEGVQVNADDGRLDMFIVRARSLAEYMGVLTRFFVPADPQNEATMRHFHIRETVSIEAERPLMVQADGEVIGETPVQLRIIPDALRVIIPETQKAA